LTPAPSQTSALADTPTVPLEAHLQFRCLDVLPELPSGARVQGTWMIAGDKGEPTYLLNVETGDKITLSQDNTNLRVPGGVVSPNGKWLAYSQIDNATDPKHATRSIRIIAADGQLQKYIPYQPDWLAGLGWLNNDELLIERRGDPLSSVIVLNPFTGQQTTLLSNYPDIYNIPPPVSWDEFSSIGVVYDPTLTKAVYTPGMGYTLWGLRAQQVIAQVPAKAAAEHPPRWSPDGTRFVFASPQTDLAPGISPDEELYSADVEGHVT
jgi:hypothetical protein